MTLLSKQLFYEKIGPDIQCRHLHFWYESCLKGNALFSYWVYIGSLKFFLPIYILKAIVNHKKAREKTFWKNLALEELRSALYGLLLGNLFLATNCLLCKLYGRLHYYNLGLVSGLVSGLSVLVETKENHTLDTLIFANLVVEAAFRNLDRLQIFRFTKGREIVLFMLVSSLLMSLLQKRTGKYKQPNFWFYTPRPSNEQATCSHEEACANFALKGLKSYFLLGYMFSVVRKIVPKMLVLFQKKSEIFEAVLSKDHVKFGTFIGAYVGLYRYIFCYLSRRRLGNPKYYGAIAGLLSGSTYAISPTLQVLTVGITTVLQIVFNHILNKAQVKNKFVPEQVVFMLCQSLLLHNAIVAKETCPPYYVNVLDTCTNHMFHKIYDEIITKHILT